MVYGHKQTSIHTHFRNAVPLVWGSLRLVSISYIILYYVGPLNSTLGYNLTNCIEDLRTKLAGFKSYDIATKTLPVSQTLTQLERSGVQTMRVWPVRVSWSLGNFIISVVNV